MKKLETKIPPPIILILSGLGIWLLRNNPPFIPLEYNTRIIISVAFLGIGLLIDFLALGQFRQKRTTINPLAPNNTSALAVGGIYKFTRNPMYLGMVFILLGWAIISKSMYGFIIIPLFIKYIEVFQIIPEERILKEKFGETYEAFTQKVRRWL